MRDESQDTLFGSKKWRGGEGKNFVLFWPLALSLLTPKSGVFWRGEKINVHADQYTHIIFIVFQKYPYELKHRSSFLLFSIVLQHLSRDSVPHFFLSFRPFVPILTFSFPKHVRVLLPLINYAVYLSFLIVLVRTYSLLFFVLFLALYIAMKNQDLLIVRPSSPISA